VGTRKQPLSAGGRRVIDLLIMGAGLVRLPLAHARRVFREAAPRASEDVGAVFPFASTGRTSSSVGAAGEYTRVINAGTAVPLGGRGRTV
jgi:hypothetical protein